MSNYLKSVDYWPCKAGEALAAEQCPEDEATFWGVYVRKTDDTAVHIVDVPYSDEARDVAKRLQSVLQEIMDDAVAAQKRLRTTLQEVIDAHL